MNLRKVEPIEQDYYHSLIFNIEMHGGNPLDYIQDEYYDIERHISIWRYKRGNTDHFVLISKTTDGIYSDRIRLFEDTTNVLIINVWKGNRLVETYSPKSKYS